VKRLLQIWLVGVLIAQIGHYFLADSFGFNPRLGLTLIEYEISGTDYAAIVVCLVIAILSRRIAAGGRAAMGYIVFEALYAVATVGALVIAVKATLVRPAELPIPAMMYALASLVPAAMAWRIRRRS
jgi:hypothetical protein